MAAARGVDFNQMRLVVVLLAILPAFGQQDVQSPSLTTILNLGAAPQSPVPVTAGCPPGKAPDPHIKGVVADADGCVEITPLPPFPEAPPLPYPPCKPYGSGATRKAKIRQIWPIRLIMKSSHANNSRICDRTSHG